MVVFNRITIVGVGLIGGSLAKAIRKKHLCKKIIGFFRKKRKLNKAIKEKIVDEGYLDLKKSICKSDLIILALPINQIINFMAKVKRIQKANTILMDVGSTKSKVITAANKLNLNFVGTHPLAGSEKRGMDFSSSKLFDNSKVLIAPTKKTNKQALNKIKLFWKRLNAKIIILTPNQHDKILSYTSHLPHLSSFCLINSIPSEYLAFGASGLKDTTRIALSDAQIWTDILLSNKKELLLSIKSFESQIGKLKRIINKNKRNQLISFLNLSKNKRKKIV
ncbi:MAG: prephenate dehydrogenase [Candidatus Omnitrophica bacterium]|nr:prephenate dehydrogenase [Candidatus Omnitrophota bacterium]